LELSASSTGTGAPDGWLGVLGVLASLAIVADLALERIADARLPAIAGSRATTRLVLAIGAAACVALKFLLNVHFSLFGFGFWAAVVLAGVLVVFARRLAPSAGRAPKS
jgi:Na+-transporting NADH:ubiquinone oxidoreductase subunit NqrB